MRQPGLILLFAGSWVLLGCGSLRPVDANGASASAETGEGDGEAGSDAEGVGDSESSGSTDSGTTTNSNDDDDEDDSGQCQGFLGCHDFGSGGCNPGLQDCPEGEKCTAYVTTPGYCCVDANKCVPIIGDGQLGVGVGIEGRLQVRRHQRRFRGDPVAVKRLDDLVAVDPRAIANPKRV